jgi:hypothetical protein
MTFEDFIDELYLSLMDKGYKLPEIDEMDLWHYLRLLQRREEIEKRREAEATIRKMDALGI